MASLKLYGTLGLMAPILAYSCIATSIMLSPWFSWTENYLSDLGARDISSIPFNFGLMISSLLAITFSTALLRIYKKGVKLLSVVFYILASISLFMVGLFPETAGRIHLYVSVAFFIFTAFTLLTFGALSVAISPRSIKAGISFMLLGLISSAIWALPWRGLAIPELISSLAISSWTIYMAVKTLR